MPTWFIWPYRWNLHNTFNLHYAVVPAFPISFCIRIDETSRYLLEGGGVRRFLFWWEGGEEIIWFSGEIGKVGTMTGNKGDLKNTPEPQGESGKLSIWNNQNPPPPRPRGKFMMQYWEHIIRTFEHLFTFFIFIRESIQLLWLIGRVVNHF